MDKPAFTVEEHPGEESWLRARRGPRIGGSDAASVWGVSPYSSPLALFLAKTTDPDPEDAAEEGEWLGIGRVLEDPIARLYMERAECSLRDLGRYTILRSGDHPFMFATLDRLIIDHPDRDDPGVLECKNRSAWAMQDWADKAPLDVELQLVHAFAVTGYRWGVVAALVGGNRFRYIQIERDEELVQMHIAKCKEFADMIELREPPQADGSEWTAAALKKMFPREGVGSVALPDEAAQWATERAAASEEKRLAEKRYAEASSKLRQAIGDAAMGVLPDGRSFSCKTVSRAGYTVEPTSYRELRAVKGKAKP
jgi:putative phage-type endonuclease